MREKINSIQIANRYRQEFGDIEGLANSIKITGLLNPILLDSNHRLIDGERRIRAFKLLGLDEIECRIVNVPSLLRAEHDANAFSKQWTTSEKVAIGRAIEEEIGNRRGTNQYTKEDVENFPHPKGKSRDLAAEKAGFGNGRTYQQAKKVVDNGANELVDAMDKREISVSTAAIIASQPKDKQKDIIANGRDEILRAAKEIRRQEREAKKAANEKLKAQSPNRISMPGKYQVIVIDPPWEMAKIERDERPNQSAFDYPTLNEQELADFGVGNIADNDCHLFCWTTQKHVQQGFRLLDAWGFRYVCLFVWHKPGGFQPIGLPQYNCEFVLYARKGSPKFIDTKQFFTCFNAPRREHSRKPDEFYDTVARVTDGPRIDVFSRESRDGFDSFGNEKGQFAA